MKTDRSIKNISIAAVKRHTIPPIDFPFTTLYDNEEIDRALPIPLAENELPIAQTQIDELNWTLVTTRRVISCINGTMQELPVSKIKTWNPGDFKGIGKKPFSTGNILSEEGENIDILIETGRASMIVIYSIMTMARMEWKLP